MFFKKKDIFGHDTQGFNYDTYSPTYPNEIIEKIPFGENK